MTVPGDPVALAKDYPFAIPAGSYVFTGDGVRAADAVDEGHLAGRVALLAVGANGAPAALARKLGDAAAGAAIPVLAATLHGFDVVYSAHLSPYGAIPGTLLPAPGAVAHLHVIHPDPRELAILHRTEPNYVFGELSGIDLRPAGAEPIAAVRAYISRHGCLAVDGRPVGVAGIRVEGRVEPALSEPAVLEVARERLAPDADLDAFIAENVRDPELARRRTAELRTTAIPFSWPGWRALEP